MTMTANESQAYASLTVLKNASDALIASLPEDEIPISDSERDALCERIGQFIDQATMAGTVLDAPDDRRAAQALVDFWLAKSYAIASEAHTKQRSSAKASTLLWPFDLAAVTATAAKGDRVLASLSRKDEEEPRSFLRQIVPRFAPWLGKDAASYQDLARRMLLRAIRLSEGEETCEAVTVKRNDLLSLGDLKRSKEVFDALVASGVLHVESNETGDMVSLRYDALTREWDALRSMIAERADFRGTALIWDRRARSIRALGSAGQANRALTDYADLNALEREYIAARSSYGRNMVIAMSLVCAVAFPALGVVSKHLYDRWAAAKEEAEIAKLVLVAVTTNNTQLKEQTIRKLAQYRKPLNLQSQLLQDLDLEGLYTGTNTAVISEFFQSAIVKVNLSGATLPYASFSQSNIQNVNFSGAELSSARFDEAIITKTNFSGATLYRAIFDYAQFNDVNDFSNTDLRSTSFRNVTINGDLTFTGTAWWLAFGWTLPQIEKFAAQYGKIKIEDAKIFNKDIDARKKNLAGAGGPENHARALNEVAWTYAIYGADLPSALKSVNDALDELKKIKGASKEWLADSRANFTDTKAYILLQLDKPKDAVDLFGGLERDEALSRGDLLFKYAIALHALATLEKSDDERRRLDQKAETYLEKSLKGRNYVPSHELYLLRDYIKDAFRAQLAAKLSKESN
ncbi:pentapeptide repeat-containing protein [Bradyrhizobium sp. B117]|uniref:pentapeptide repeat-containing protein n=1 Tax=Bradyrhizobium sp. B117 TaxID=3140246 RepID=UPI0031838F2F